MALGIAAFALASLLALLPLGVKTNQVSYEETRAAGWLSVVEADLRNSHPRDVANAGRSHWFGLNLPYKWNATTTSRELDASLPARRAVGVREDGDVVELGVTPPPRYQVTVFYFARSSGTAQRHVPLQARVVIHWPAFGNSTFSDADVTDLAKVGGYVDSLMAFPAP